MRRIMSKKLANGNIDAVIYEGSSGWTEHAKRNSTSVHE